MPREKLTARFVENVKSPASGQIDYFDTITPAFGLRVSSTGAKSWFAFTRIDEKQVRLTLGRFPVMSLADARTAAGKAFDAVEAGRDPRLEQQQERAAARREQASTVKAVATLYLASIGAVESPGESGEASQKKRRKAAKLRSAREIKRILERYVLPVIGDRPIATVTRGELIDLFDEIADVNGGPMANRTLAWTRRFFNWAIARDYISASPCVGIEKPGEETSGKRVLNDVEIRVIWVAAETLDYPRAHFIKALFLTGRRRTSVSEMRASEIDQAAKVWRPGAGTPNKGAPELPLSTALADLIESIPEAKVTGGDYLLSFRLKGNAPVNSFSAIKADLDAAIVTKRGDQPAIEPWTFHDVRRTVKTRLAELGVSKEIRDLIMGHFRQGMDRVYDHSERREEKRAGLERWAAHLQDILDPPAGDNVVAMRTRK